MKKSKSIKLSKKLFRKNKTQKGGTHEPHRNGSTHSHHTRQVRGLPAITSRWEPLKHSEPFKRFMNKEKEKLEKLTQVQQAKSKLSTDKTRPTVPYSPVEQQIKDQIMTVKRNKAEEKAAALIAKKKANTSEFYGRKAKHEKEYLIAAAAKEAEEKQAKIVVVNKHEAAVKRLVQNVLRQRKEAEQKQIENQENQERKNRLIQRELNMQAMHNKHSQQIKEENQKIKNNKYKQNMEEEYIKNMLEEIKQSEEQEITKTKIESIYKNLSSNLNLISSNNKVELETIEPYIRNQKKEYERMTKINDLQLLNFENYFNNEIAKADFIEYYNKLKNIYPNKDSKYANNIITQIQTDYPNMYEEIYKLVKDYNTINKTNESLKQYEKLNELDNLIKEIKLRQTLYTHESNHPIDSAFNPKSLKMSVSQPNKPHVLTLRKPKTLRKPQKRQTDHSTASTSTDPILIMY